MPINIKDNSFIGAVKGSGVLTYPDSLLHSEVIRYRAKQKWSGVDHILIERYGEQYKKEIEMLNGLAASCLRYRMKGSVISLDRNAYSAANKLTGQGISYRKTRKLLDLMDEDGLILLYIGYWDTEKEMGIPSFFIMNDSYLDLWEGIDTSKAMKVEQESVVIRDSKTKENLPTRGFKGIALLKADLSRYNSLLKANEVYINGEQVVPTYKRVFHDSLKGSGRYYSHNSFQTIEKERRDEISINGNTTVELDYAAIHPRILYSQEGIVLSKEWSPYSIGISKDVSKMCLLPMLYAKSRHEAVNASWMKLKDRGHTREDVDRWVSALEERNRDIAHYFYQEKLWKALQYLDSCIASNVLSMCVKRNIVALPYHDSFRVEEDNAEILLGIMFEAWQAVIGNTSNCVVERK